MRTERDRREAEDSGASSGPGAPIAADARLPYDAPRLMVHGSLVDLTQRRGGPGRDNPHFQRSF
jgi:hypothetical protein